MAKDYFDEHIAEHYDEEETDMFEAAAINPAVDFLANLADGGNALELGIGTGRIALPLSQRGIKVHGIELSNAMTTKLLAKAGSEHIDLTMGDFATTKVEGNFSLTYLVFNTIMNLTTQAEQVNCFQNVSSHLKPGGSFVIEVLVPELQRLPPSETKRGFQISPTKLRFDEYDIATQELTCHYYSVENDKLQSSSIPFRYVWPSELDLMAQQAGMVLQERWSNWTREPFTHTSKKHVSVWKKHHV